MNKIGKNKKSKPQPIGIRDPGPIRSQQNMKKDLLSKESLKEKRLLQ